MLLVVFLFLSFAFGASPRSRAEALLAQMTLEEKISMLHGSSGPYVGQTAPITRLSIPALTMEDGPQGVADGVKDAVTEKISSFFLFFFFFFFFFFFSSFFLLLFSLKDCMALCVDCCTVLQCRHFCQLCWWHG